MSNEIKHISIGNTTYDIRDPNAVRSSDLATVAISGSYNDLSDSPTIPSKTSDLTNDSGFINKSIYAGTCSTAAATMPKVCTVDTFPTTESNGVTHAADRTMIAVVFSVSDTNDTDAPKLNVNNIGAKAIYYSNAKVTSTVKNTTVAGTKNVLAYYYYDSSLDSGNGAWVYMGKSVDSNSTYSNASLGLGYATLSNAAAATAITATLSSYSLSTGGIVAVKFSYDVPANATLNVNSKGAKAIYNRGAAITADVIKAGDTATFIYSTYYHLISIDRDKMERIVINATESNGALTFTDADNNALTHALVRVILNNLNNHVLLRFQGSEFTKTIGDEDWWEFERQAFRTTRFVDFVWANSRISIDDGGSSTLDDYYVPIGRTINSKVLSSNITLTASDVGALPASTTIPSKTSDLINDSGFTSNAGTITGITMNGASKGTSGVVDLGTVITSHQDISGKANSADLATVATSGSYNDLSNKPTIPAAVTVDSTITQNGTNPVQGGAIYSALDGKVKCISYDDENELLSDTSQPHGTIGYDYEDGWFYFYDSDGGWVHICLYSDLIDRIVDLVPASLTINGKALSSNITLNASDVGALPSSTSIPSDLGDLTNSAGYTKYVLCTDEAAYNAIANKDSGTLYLIPES